MRYLALKQGVRGGVGIAADFWHAKGCDKGRGKGRGVLKSGLAGAILWATSNGNYRRGRTCVVGAIMIDGQQNLLVEGVLCGTLCRVLCSVPCSARCCVLCGPFVAPFAASLVATVAAFLDVLSSGELLALTRCGRLL